MKPQPIQFKAVIKQHRTMNAAFVEFPFSTEKLFNKKGQVKIKALFDDKVEYRGSLAKMKSECHMLGLTQEIRKQLGKTFGDEVSVSLIEDKEERTVEIADDILIVFNENPEAKALFDKMSYTHRKEYIRWINEAKKPETRENRKIKMIKMILDGKKGV
ncbi:Bacteriocin-protection, YdeI or OmpD-Associated [Chryseobacterium taichungense]|uniref:Bacteriocin-protection, YdeI or OmpD-Associated n=1 Tax=Chryseobacterium taichungense TaxID=295069 RepID=A0A1H8AT25_9FLAO|nr:YdeI/OmpD-associated family protein [Chryseobacterium taichungense]SEM73855.1 Bacteriocin-protection, YdeI or OmpD-Associated [Chryseobacterium taichungense]